MTTRFRVSTGGRPGLAALGDIRALGTRNPPEEKYIRQVRLGTCSYVTKSCLHHGPLPEGVVSFLGAQSSWLSWALAIRVPMTGALL